MFPSRFVHALAGVLLIGFSAGSVEAQTITRISPEAASTGDTVRLIGTNLQGTTQVRFFAVVGGFVGTWTVNVAPSSVSPTLVTAVVPQMAAFAPPNAAPPGDPVGSVTAIGSGAASNSVKFFYLQATPNINTLGNGSPQPGGIGAAAISFTLAGGPPESPNPNFVLTLENAVPGSAAILAIGLPGTTPYPIIAGGTFTLNPLAPIVLLPPLPVDAAGDIQIPAAIPAGVVGTFALQWIVQAPGPFLSNGLEIGL